MANEKKIKSKIIHKHDTATNWTTAGNNGYIPDKGEFIIYDADSNVDYERIKVGDGATNINNLPFANALAEKATQDGDGNVIVDTYATKEYVDKRIEDFESYETNSIVGQFNYVPENAARYAKVKEIGGITRKCANLLQLEEKTESSQGVTFTVENGTITANGTATSTAAFSCQTPELIAGKTYTISSGVTTGSSSTYQMFISSDIGAFSNIYNIKNGSSFTPVVTGIANIKIYVYPNTTVSNLVFKPMLNEGATALPFESYFEGLRSAPVTALESTGSDALSYAPYTIPSEVLALNGYGMGVSDTVFNSIEWKEDKRVFNKRVGVADMGTLNWTMGGSTYASGTFYISCGIIGMKPSVSYTDRKTGILCGEYNASGPIGFADMDDKSILKVTTRFYCRDSRYSDLESFKAAVSGVMLYYELATPEEIDISHILPADNLIEVGAGGKVKAVNESGFAVFTSIEYQRDINKEIDSKLPIYTGNVGGIKVYIQRKEGNTSVPDVMDAQYGAVGGVALRGQNGVFVVGTPTADNHATTKKYVDDKFVDGEFTTSVGVPEIKLDKNGLYYEHNIDGNTHRADLLRTEDGGVNLTTGVQAFSMLPSGTSFKAGTIYATEGMYYFPSESEQPQPIATQDFVTDKIAEFVDSAPETLNTLNELAAALGDDPNFATTVATEIGKKVDKTTTINGKALSGNITLTQEDIGVSLESLGVTATANELNYTEGVTSNIQEQLDRKVESTTTFIDNEVAYTKKLPQYTSAYAQLNSIGGAAITGEQTIYNFTYQGFDFYVPAGMSWDEFAHDYNSGATSYEGNTYNSFYDYQGNYVSFQGGGFSITTGPFVEDWVKSDPSVTYTTSSGGQTLLPVKVTAIEITGANLIPFPYTHSSMERNGLKIVVNDDGTITAKGTPTASLDFVYSNVFPGFEHGKSYRIGSGVIIAYKNAEGATKYAETKITWDDSYTFTKIYYYFAANKTFDVTYYPMINEGTILHPYAKYSKEIISIPQEVLGLPGYGAGNPSVPTECNSIEWTDETAKYVQRGSITNGEWVSLDTPVITDITSQIFERNIKVECCGYLTFINSDQAPVPSSVTIHTDNVDVLAADVFVGDLVGEANKAEYAEKDTEGNVIADTYFKNNSSASSLYLKNVELNNSGISTISDNGRLERIRFSGGNLELNGSTINANCGTFVINNSVGLDMNGLFLKNQNSDGSVDRWDLHKIDLSNTENSYIGGTRVLTVSSETLHANNVMVGGSMNLYTSGMSEPQPFATQAYVDAKIAESGGGNSSGGDSSSGSGSSGGSTVTSVSVDISALTWGGLGQIGPDETNHIGWSVSLGAAGIPSDSKAFIWTIHNAGYPSETGCGASGFMCTYGGGKVQITSNNGLVMMNTNNPANDYSGCCLHLVIFS